MSQGCPECLHVLPSGRKCGALALRGQTLCHAHARSHRLTQANRARRHSVALPPLEDRAAIQMSIDEVLAAYASNKISRRQTSTYLYAIDLAARNLTRLELLPPPAPTELSLDPLPDLPSESLQTHAGTVVIAPQASQIPTGPAQPAEPPSTQPAQAAPIRPTPQPDPSDTPPTHSPEYRAQRETMLARYREWLEKCSESPESSDQRAYLRQLVDSLEAELQALDQQDASAPPPEAAGCPTFAASCAAKVGGISAPESTPGAPSAPVAS